VDSAAAQAARRRSNFRIERSLTSETNVELFGRRGGPTTKITRNTICSLAKYSFKFILGLNGFAKAQLAET
jgi:hypothetical protein